MIIYIIYDYKATDTKEGIVMVSNKTKAKKGRITKYQ